MFGGIYILTNANGLQINKILNLSSIFETTFRISFGTTTFITTGVGAVIGVGEIVSTYSPAPYSFNLVYRTKGDDYIKIKQQNIALTDTNEVTEVGLFL
jgi:hypothetical protein